MKLSIVATLYQSARHVEEFCRRAGESAIHVAGDDYEIVLVHDGSPDDSLARAVRVSEVDPHVAVIDLSRNFGHHKAMMTGLRYARGEQVFLLDSDLEEEPEWLMAFFKQMRSEGCDVVYGIQDTRKGGSIERWSGSLYYWTVRSTTGLVLPDNIVTARLMTRDYVNALLQHDEREMFMAGLWSITGFDQRPQTVHKRSSSTTTYTLGRKLTLLVNSITSFSSAPLVGIFYLGLFISLVAGSYTGYLIIHWVFLANPPSGWTSVMASIWLLGGLLILFIGIIGIYLSKIFSEAKRRPYTIVRKVYGRRNE